MRKDRAAQNARDRHWHYVLSESKLNDDQTPSALSSGGAKTTEKSEAQQAEFRRKAFMLRRRWKIEDSVIRNRLNERARRIRAKNKS